MMNPFDYVESHWTPFHSIQLISLHLTKWRLHSTLFTSIRIYETFESMEIHSNLRGYLQPELPFSCPSNKTNIYATIPSTFVWGNLTSYFFYIQNVFQISYYPSSGGFLTSHRKIWPSSQQQSMVPPSKEIAVCRTTLLQSWWASLVGGRGGQCSTS